MSSITKNSNESLLDVFSYITMLVAFSLQNKTTFNIILVSSGSLRLNIYDCIIMICLFSLFFRFTILQKRGFLLIEWILVGLFFCFLCIGIVNLNNFSSIIYDFRSYSYLFMVFFITRNFEGNSNFYFRLFEICSFSCCLWYLYTFIGGSGNGVIIRLVDFNFSIILLYLAFSISYYRYKGPNLFNLINIFLGAIVILTTQTRTLIAPLLVVISILSLYILLRVRGFLSKMLILTLTVLFVVLLLTSNLKDLAFERFEAQSNQNSTLDLRINSFKYNYSSLTNSEKVLGGGLGKDLLYYADFSSGLKETYTLELFIGEYLIKFGYLGTFLVNLIFLFIIIKRKKKVSMYFLISLLIVLSILSISGLSNYTGQFFLGLSLGILCNRRLWEKYNKKVDSRIEINHSVIKQGGIRLRYD